jgi:hypothetical protein
VATENKTQDSVQPRPFHETVIELLSVAPAESLYYLATFIKSTAVPANHTAIMAAWNQRRTQVGFQEDDGVTAYLWEQKAVAEQKKADEQKRPHVDSASLEAVHQKTGKLLDLMNDPRYGLSMWHGLMRDGLQDLHLLTCRLTSTALGK